MSLPEINEQKSFFYARDFFLRLLGCLYFVAFSSIWTQVVGLIGREGVLPADAFLKMVAGQYGWSRVFLVPGIFWLNASDLMLQLVCGLGVICSVLVCVGLIPALNLGILYVLYLSLVSVGGPFLAFQWDALLLETGFLAIFLAPWSLCLSKTHRPPSRIVIFLFRLLLFKLMLQSGLVKILSGDPAWADYTALNYHYWTQPLPNPLSWFMHNLPAGVNQFNTIVMFVIELIVPFGIFINRWTRLSACWLLMYLQVFIMLTGNYCFFNLLTIALCILLIDDRFFLRYLKLPRFLNIHISFEEDPGKGFWYWSKRVCMYTAVTLLLLSNLYLLIGMAFPRREAPAPLAKAYRMVTPYGICNSYGLFAIMTKSRPEIILEGSMDNVNWTPYKFAFKPGALDRMPVQAAPHQPRLDWQLWFAALKGNYQHSPWVLALMKRLLDGSKSVEGLFRELPFNEPPQYIRAQVYMYEFTTPAERKATGNWWKRTYDGVFAPSLSLDIFGQARSNSF